MRTFQAILCLFGIVLTVEFGLNAQAQDGPPGDNQCATRTSVPRESEGPFCPST